MKTEVMRLAMRAEGNFWNAYLAMPKTMDGAILIGSIRMRPCLESDDVQAGFMALMKMVANVALEGVGVEAAEWNDPVPGPEHERAGRG